MQIILNLLILAVGVSMLVKAADWFTDAAIEVAHKLRIPKIIVGVTFVSLATTLPEFAVSLTATVAGKVDMAVGNAVGSTICNVGLILGLCAMLSPMGVARAGFLVSGAGLLALGGTFAVLGYFFQDGSRITGLVMILCLLVYIFAMVHSSLQHRRRNTEEAQPSMMTTAKVILLFVLGAIGIVAGSKLMVYAAEKIAVSLGVSELVISLTIVAIGTSTPELVVSLASIIKKERSLSIGNIIGANILNLAWVIGACSLVRPLPIQTRSLVFDFPIMLLMSLLLLIFGWTDEKLSRWEGAVLFAIYMAFLIGSFFLFGNGGSASSIAQL